VHCERGVKMTTPRGGRRDTLGYPRAVAPPLSEFMRARFDNRHVRYTTVSVVAVVCSQSLLLLLQAFGTNPAPANIIAVTFGCVPSYTGNRYWVWGKRGKNHFWREVMPFWAIALVGLAFSTLLVFLASKWTHNPIVINGANLVAFGTLWVFKYMLLDQLLFKVAEHELAAA
jgi:putative flippase GtrA